MALRKICVFTGTRAEYGLLRPLMQEIAGDRRLKLQILCSGMHLSREFGFTYKEIELDGFDINEKVDMILGSDSPEGICKSTGLGIGKFAESYAKLKPDIVVVLGDRFETFAAAFAAMISRIPVAHVGGGDATYGLIDEAIRHSITKMSQLHFTTTSEYRHRVIQLGEDPRRVFCTGALGIDNIRSLKPLSKVEFEKWAGIKLKKRNLLITFHSVTLEHNTSKLHFGKLLKVLDGLKETNLFFTKANADTFGRVINVMIDDYVAHNRHKARAYASMGQLRYLSAMKYVDALVGNSSSGIIEAPSFKKGVINIGCRQAGRIRAKNVIDCLPEEKNLRSAINKLYSSQFKHMLRSVVNPYGNGNTAKKIKKILCETDLDKILIKIFYDVPLVIKNR